MNCALIIALRALSSRHAHRQICPLCPSTQTFLLHHFRSPGGMWSLAVPCAALVEAWPSDERVAIIGTGHLSLELGGPRQFGPHGPDPDFDRKAVEWIATGDIEGTLREVTLDSLWIPGNATHGFLDFMLMMGVAGAVRADYADTLDLFHTMEAYFTWYPNGVDA